MTDSAEGARAASTERRRVAGFDLRVRYADPRIAARLVPWLDHFLPGAPGAPAIPVELDLDVASPGDPGPPLRDGEPLVEYYYVSGAYDPATGRSVFSGEDGSWLSIDAARGVCRGRIPATALDGPPWPLRDLFNAALTTLLRARGVFPLHAAALVKNGEGLIIVGAPMSGKTTLALNLVRRGWHWVADDKVLISADGDGAPDARGLMRLSNIDPALAGPFPELGPLVELPPAHPHSPKRGVSIGDFYGGVERDGCRPSWLFFPRVVDLGPTRVEALDAKAAFGELLRQSPVVRDRQQARAQLQILSRLAASARAWRLLAGRDILDDPARLDALGREMGVPVGLPPGGERLAGSRSP